MRLTTPPPAHRNKIAHGEINQSYGIVFGIMNKKVLIGLLILSFISLSIYLSWSLNRKPTFEIGTLETRMDTTDSYFGSTHSSTFLLLIKTRKPLRVVRLAMPVDTVTKCSIKGVETMLEKGSCNATSNRIEGMIENASGLYSIKVNTIEPLTSLPLDKFSVEWE